MLCKQNIKQDQIETEQHYKHSYKHKDLVKHKPQDKQTYKYKSCPEGQVLRVRLGKKGWKSSMGKHVISEQPRKFYDYNF